MGEHRLQWSGTAKLSLGCAISLVLAGCVTTAREQKGAAFGVNYAEATFRLGIDDTVGFAEATSQEYLIGNYADRNSPGRVTLFTFLNKEDKPFLLPAGEKIFVFANLSTQKGSAGYLYAEDYCRNASIFTPLANTRYDIVQSRVADQGCMLTVVEAETGAPPADLEQIRHLRPWEVSEDEARNSGS